MAEAPPRKKGGALRGITGEPRRGGGEGDIYLTEEGAGALVLASREGLGERVKALLAGGSDPEESDRNTGETALTAAAGGESARLERPRPQQGARRVQCVRALVQAGASADRLDDCGRTPLTAAAAAGRSACVKVLLDLGADAELQGTDGATALGIAAHLGHTSCVRLLVQRGASVEATWGGDKRTPLMAAASAGHEACVRLLLSEDARASRKDSLGRTARDHAAAAQHVVCENLLEVTSAPQAVARLAAAAAASLPLRSEDVFPPLADGLKQLDLDSDGRGAGCPLGRDSPGGLR